MRFINEIMWMIKRYCIMPNDILRKILGNKVISDHYILTKNYRLYYKDRHINMLIILATPSLRQPRLHSNTTSQKLNKDKINTLKPAGHSWICL